MSGNSPWSRRQTEPIVCSRRRCARSVVIGAEEDEPVLADLDLVAVLQLGVLDPVAVEERAVQAAEVLERERARAPATTIAWRRETVTSSRKMSQSGVRPIVVCVALEREVLAGAAAAGAHDERRALDAELLQPGSPLLLDFLGGERHGRVVRVALGDEQRAAAGAVVGGFQVLEPALGAVDVAHVGRRRRGLAREDLGQPVEVDLAELPSPFF